MSNDTPPRACLADLGFMTMVLDPDRPMSCSTNLNSGTLMFMLPELLAPQRFGAKNPTPTPQSDVYAFGLVIFQVFKDDEYLLSTYTVQVLTGETPFRDFGPIGCTPSIINGLRPDKPNNAPAIGFSDPLWDFTQRCWDANMESRPGVAEVVALLSQATANWNRVMGSYVKVDPWVATDSEEVESDSKKHCEFEVIITP